MGVINNLIDIKKLIKRVSGNETSIEMLNTDVAELQDGVANIEEELKTQQSTSSANITKSGNNVCFNISALNGTYLHSLVIEEALRPKERIFASVMIWNGSQAKAYMGYVIVEPSGHITISYVSTYGGSAGEMTDMTWSVFGNVSWNV